MNDKLLEVFKPAFDMVNQAYDAVYITRKPVRAIPVREENSLYVMDKDGVFHCQHIDAAVEPPCCSSPADINGNVTCDCHGQYSVYCYECNNDDMTEKDVERILNSYFAQYED